MSVEIKLKKKKGKKNDERDEKCDITNMYSKNCSSENKQELESEEKNYNYLKTHNNENEYLYPILDDPNFNIKIAEKKEFMDTKYDGSIHPVEKHSEMLKTAEYELLPQQAFVRNFLSFQTPYNSLVLFHGLGSGKTCSAIGVCEEMRDYLNQMGITKRIIIVASPNVQDNFRLQLFDERKLKQVDGIWTMKGCLGNKLLKEINPTGMKGLTREKVIQQVNRLINSAYSFQGYIQFSNEIVKNSGNPSDSNEIKNKNLEFEYSNRLIVIDEVHNIRISDDNENKNVAINLTRLVHAASNVRLLLLSATPMFNSYKEIIWILNLMNINDRRGIISVSDVFNKDGSWKKDKNGEEIGKEILIRKATGYVSYVRGENPYTFPFRVYPERDTFGYSNTFQGDIYQYPIYQINGTKIPQENKKYPIQKLSLFLTAIGEYQRLGYKYIVDSLRSRQEGVKITKKGKQRKITAFSALKSFGYTDLQIPIEALNIVYPYPDLEELVDQIPEFKYIDKYEEEPDEIAPLKGNAEIDVVKEIQEGMDSGPFFNISDSFFNISEEENLNDASISTINMSKKEIDPNETYNSIFKDDSIKPSSELDYSEKLFNMSELTDTSYKGSLKKKGGSKSNSSDSSNSSNSSDSSNSSNSSKSSKQKLHIDPKELTGTQGLKRIMNYVDTKTPGIKGQFEYKKDVPKVFQQNEIGKYSSKIKNVCDYIYNKNTDTVSDGIILVYSSYIDGGLIPMALALEEMGFTRYGEKATSLFKTAPVPLVDVRTMKPPTDKKDFKPARYVMITGDHRISPNNDNDVKIITGDDNIYKEDSSGKLTDISGEIIKVVLISQAGSEGLDFKAIRQVHILEPWYNINRIEQIIGRGVRNFSHKDLPFKKRNVQIFLYGTILDNSEEESADLYIYRVSETKAVKIGKVTRLLKQTAVDCIINHDQTKFIPEEFQTKEENRNVVQELSDHTIVKNFEIGDKDNSATCDFMECKFQCLPNFNVNENDLNNYTYNETFMLVNSDKIIQKIKILMKMRYFYEKKDLFNLINVPKKYPDEQIYAALTQIITDNAEYITDKYGRTGYLVNIGDYYLFQPSELNNKNISIYDRSVPISYKHDMIKFDIKSDIAKPVIDKRNIVNKREIVDASVYNNGKVIFDMMFNNYMLVLDSQKVKGENNWYQSCGVIIKKMALETDLFPKYTEKKRLEIYEQFLIYHIVDSLMINERIDLLNYICMKEDCKKNIDDDDDFEINSDFSQNDKMKRFYSKMVKYLLSKRLVSKKLIGMLMFDGPSRIENLKIFVLNDNIWKPAEAEDIINLKQSIEQKYMTKLNFYNYVGFIGFETKQKYMVYKVKDIDNPRSTGYRCDQSGKDKVSFLLDYIIDDNKLTMNLDKENKFDLCVRQELTLRALEYEEQSKQKHNRLTYFLDTETAIINEFEKREKQK